MLLKLKWTMFPVLFFLLFPISAYSSNQMEPPGKILGGSLDAPVRIEFFSNFECTHCREYYLRTIKKILQEYSSSDKVCIIYHDFPFQNHKYDRKTARYAEAASRMGRETLLKVMDALYTDQAIWSENGQIEETLAKALSKDAYEELIKIAEDPEIEPLIDAQYDLAIKTGLKSTPTSFLFYQGKEQKVEALITYIVLKSFIDKIIK